MKVVKMENIPSTWGWRLYKAGITQTAFCKKIGLNPSLLSQYIKNKSFISKERIEFIEAELRKIEA